MPKKGTRHVREPANTRSSGQQPPQQQQYGGCAASLSGTAATATDAPEVATRHFRSVHIGVTNGRRWLSLKKRLGLTTDEDVAVYLLDLAESAAVTRYVFFSWCRRRRESRSLREFLSTTTTRTVSTADALHLSTTSRANPKHLSANARHPNLSRVRGSPHCHLAFH